MTQLQQAMAANYAANRASQRIGDFVDALRWLCGEYYDGNMYFARYPHDESGPRRREDAFWENVRKGFPKAPPLRKAARR